MCCIRPGDRVRCRKSLFPNTIVLSGQGFAIAPAVLSEPQRIDCHWLIAWDAVVWPEAHWTNPWAETVPKTEWVIDILSASKKLPPPVPQQRWQKRWMTWSSSPALYCPNYPWPQSLTIPSQFWTFGLAHPQGPIANNGFVKIPILTPKSGTIF